MAIRSLWECDNEDCSEKAIVRIHVLPKGWIHQEISYTDPEEEEQGLTLDFTFCSIACAQVNEGKIYELLEEYELDHHNEPENQVGDL